MGLGSYSVLVCLDGLGVAGGGGYGVDCWDEGEVVLVAVEVVGGAGYGVGKGVMEGVVVWAEGEVRDYVGEVEGWEEGLAFSRVIVPLARGERVRLP